MRRHVVFCVWVRSRNTPAFPELPVNTDCYYVYKFLFDLCELDPGAVGQEGADEPPRDLRDTGMKFFVAGYAL